MNQTRKCGKRETMKEKKKSVSVWMWITLVSHPHKILHICWSPGIFFPGRKKCHFLQLHDSVSTTFQRSTIIIMYSDDSIASSLVASVQTKRKPFFLYLFLRKYALRQKMLEKKKNVHCYVDGCEKRWQKSVSLLFKFIWVLTLFVLYFIHFNELRDFVKRTAKRILQQFLLVACLLSYIALVSTRVEIWHIIVNEQHEQIKNG